MLLVGGVRATTGCGRLLKAIDGSIPLQNLALVALETMDNEQNRAMDLQQTHKSYSHEGNRQSTTEIFAG